MLLEIDFNSNSPIYKQIRDQIIIGIAEGLLKKDENLPSVRQLSTRLGINMHTVNKAYKMLEQEGWIGINKKRGTFINTKFGGNKDVFLERFEENIKPLLAEAEILNIKKETVLECIDKIMLNWGEW